MLFTYIKKRFKRFDLQKKEFKSMMYEKFGERVWDYDRAYKFFYANKNWTTYEKKFDDMFIEEL